MRPVHTLLTAAVLVLGTTPTLAEAVGVTAAVNPAARGTPPRQAVRTLVLGENVFHDEQIETDTGGLLQILLADGTAFTVGPNSALTIDRFVYDPKAGTAEVSASLTRGVFRFIGGRTSKTPGGVALNTPVGTIGIRGAVVDVNLAGRGGTGEIEAHIDMIFGDEVVLDGPGGLDRLYEPGYSIVIRQAAEGGRNQEVTKTPAAFRSEIQQALSGAAGTTGGSKNPPTETVVAESRVAEENSDRTPAMNNLPIPERRPENIGDRDETVIADAGSDLVRDTVEEIADRPPPVEPEEPEEPVEPPPPPPAEPTIVPLRVVTAGETYVVDGGDVISTPGAVGLIGGSAETDQSTALVIPPGGAFGTATPAQGNLVLPVYADMAFTAHPILAGSGASLNGVPLTGTAYSGADGFTAYALALDGDRTQPLYALRGTPIVDTSVLRSGDVRTYSFTPDMLQDLPVPFMRADALGPDYAGASISKFYVLEPPAGSSANPVALQSWLLISGEGTEQRSGIGVSLANLVTEDGVLQTDYGRRGSFRFDPLGFSSVMAGGVTTLAGADGGNQVFGANGENLVLTTDLDINDYMSDHDALRSPAERFSTLHVLALESEVPLAQFVEDRESTRLRNKTGSETLLGYATGLVEIGIRDGDYAQVQAASGVDPRGFSLLLDPQNGTVGGEITLIDPAGGRSVHIPFGEGTTTTDRGGRSVYIDDDLFAAASNGDRSSTYITETEDGVTSVYRQSRQNNAGTYLISGDANPQPGFLPGGELCACKFLEWGWWGTRIRSGTDPDDPELRDLQANVHLGSWVAGDLTRRDQIADLAGTTARFEGSAVGHVSAYAGDGIADYVASGAMSMDFDFGARTGTMALDDFDGRNFSGAVGDNGYGDHAQFSGRLSQDNLDAQGAVHGAFVNDGPTVAAGVVGNFALQSQSGDWGAVGIIGGARAPQQ